MYRKLIAIALALALIGTVGTAVSANDGGGAVVADYSVSEDLSPTPNQEYEDGGSGDDDGGGCGSAGCAYSIELAL